MNQLAAALGQKFAEDKDAIRIREFELGGHTFKVKVPLTAEFEVMQQRLKEIDQALVETYFKELTQDLKPGDNIESKDNDIVVDGRSMREAATNKVVVERRITEMFRMLVPEEKGFDMSTVTYDMIDELFPFPVQLQVVEAIAQVVTPSYQASKGK